VRGGMGRLEKKDGSIRALWGEGWVRGEG
jgi:hypothetical protein